MLRLFPILALFACKGETPIDLEDAPVSGSRHRMPHVEFDIWTDYLSLEVGLSDECTFLQPLVDNHSVANPPIQVFWVMYQNEEDAVDGDVVVDTFWLGDRTANVDYPVRDGLTDDGLNLDELEPQDKGVTCYFCHQVEAVEGSHNNPLVLAADLAPFLG